MREYNDLKMTGDRGGERREGERGEARGTTAASGSETSERERERARKYEGKRVSG